jgi:leucyl aminopeptidase
VAAVQPSGTRTADVVVVATVSTTQGVRLAAGAEWVEQAMGGQLSAALLTVESTGRPDEVLRIPTLGTLPAPLVIATGLGKGSPEVIDAEAARRAVGAAIRSVNSATRVAIAIGGGEPELVEAFSDGALLGSYRFDRYKSQQAPARLKRVDVISTAKPDAAVRAGLKRSRAVAAAVNAVRDLVNMPPNHLNPPSFADYAERRATALGLEVQVLDERGLRRGGFGGILAVGGGSMTPPRLVRLRYAPARAKARVALVGKGITFDTGGLDLKRAMMAQMKGDMAGAATMIEVAFAAATLGLPLEVIATIPIAENALSATAYRPSDVVTMHNGTSVEIDNTDAEGRVILADAISRACQDKPDYLIEASTLTGGQMVALGTHLTGAMGTEDFRDRVVSVGARAGESLWAMPLPRYLRENLESGVADLQNAAKERWGSMLVGGLFLADFVADSLPWVHLDIAGPSFASAAGGYNQRGGTGVMVRTVLATLRDIAQNG